MSTTQSDSYQYRQFNSSRRSQSRTLSTSSWRSVSSSRTMDSVKLAIKNSQINSEVKQKLKSIYKDYELGKLSRQEMKDIIQKDLNLETNSTFEKSIKSVNMNYTSLIRGIDKKEVNSITNFKPNTKDEQLSKQFIKTVSLNLYKTQRIPFQKNTEQIPKPDVFGEDTWLHKQIKEERIPNQNLFLPQKLLNEQEKESLQVQRELRLVTNSYQSRNNVIYKVKGPAPCETKAILNNGDIVGLKAETQLQSSKNINVSQSSLPEQRVSRLKKYEGKILNTECNQENQWSAPINKKVTQLKNSEYNFLDQENMLMFKTYAAGDTKRSKDFGNLKQLQTSSKNIISWN
ncbi:hypothetical protein TTHERM_000694478 (macronuclear) [Tetrahymena thermophila SB210]|uniref:Uncharacterized protein n=1 Tax=Tetrahymena thermophila (strain SB210) TaxID=312017 RepID=W7XGR5_TETTS|nr:hypothetical protein TTHERM_000694478 [Tetrahymena thermophila SB210]EWS72159.1 hypothetical protein TTHERM_000694478 [Tetrahymena thermophila SB210]|eukprot:XP_012655290.1 hypothetical protein TTHERM_000694478 [Tetrahymena thermophila SB210]